MNTKKVKVYAPATIANIGPGFDVLGLALDLPGDFAIAERTHDKGLVFTLKSSIGFLPTNGSNVAAHVAKIMLEELNPPFGVSLTLLKRMPIGSGLGSSGASSVAAALAVNSLLYRPLPKMELLRFVVEGERLASGSPHADNVAPSLLGGICLIRSYHPLDIIKIPFQNKFHWVAIHPHIQISTEHARILLPKEISLTLGIEQWGNVGALVAGLMSSKPEWIKQSLKDGIAEPVRSQLIPGYVDAKQAAMQAGAIGFSISGSGPTVFAIAPSLEVAQQVNSAVISVFTAKHGMLCDSYISQINRVGARIVGSEV